MSQPAREASPERRIWAILGLTVLYIVGCVVVLGIGLRVAYTTYFIPSASMLPTLAVHDVILASKFAYESSPPKAGDIVTLDPPIKTTNRFVKRIAGVPGDTLRIHDGKLYVNGAVVAEPYAHAPANYDLDVRDYGIIVDGVRLTSAQANIPPKAKWTSPNTIPPGCYFVLGDNRNDSEDSHMWGFAQSSAAFYTGEEAGKVAGGFEKIERVLFPSEHARVL